MFCTDISAKNDRKDFAIYTQYIDLIELNHSYYYDSDNYLWITNQLIFWEWDGLDYQLIDWKLVQQKDGWISKINQEWVQHQIQKKTYLIKLDPISQTIIPSYYNNRYISTFYNSADGNVYKIIAKQFKESWTDYDAVIEAMHDYPLLQRKGLIKNYEKKRY